MKEIKKELYLDEIRLSQVLNAPYELILSPLDSHLKYENQKSSFIMGKETLSQCGINKISRDLLGSLFELTLKKIRYKGPKQVTKNVYTDNRASNQVSINALKKIEETKWFGFELKYKSKTEIYYLLELKTPYMGGTLYTLPCPMYDIKLDLTKEEYEDIKKFDENTEFIVDLRLKEKHGKEKYG